jgi:hypothetical protein
VNKVAGAGQLGHDSQDRTAVTRQLGQDSRDRTVLTGQQNKTTMSGNLDRTEGTGHVLHDN